MNYEVRHLLNKQRWAVGGTLVLRQSSQPSMFSVKHIENNQ
jgi:hypothetical protein